MEISDLQTLENDLKDGAKPDYFNRNCTRITYTSPKGVRRMLEFDGIEIIEDSLILKIGEKKFSLKDPFAQERPEIENKRDKQRAVAEAK